jgi:hypothetical protein
MSPVRVIFKLKDPPRSSIFRTSNPTRVLVVEDILRNGMYDRGRGPKLRLRGNGLSEIVSSVDIGKVVDWLVGKGCLV